MKVKIEYKLQDFWVGIFWKSDIEHGQGETVKRYHIWICLIPCFPIHIITKYKFCYE